LIVRVFAASWERRHLSPPDNALGICVEENSQRQALERTQPVRPIGFGYVEGITHGYKRHARPRCLRR